MDVSKVQARLKRIEGQIRGISDMADKDVPCEDILVQINAAKAALHKVGQVILEGHLQHCVREGIEHGDPEKTIADFAKAVEHFSRMG
jgi:DNA-binding FrmR family transcriptional regulator